MNDSKTHPSWGRIVVTHPTGGRKRLFGSSAIHNSVMRMEIEQASLQRDLSTDWMHGTDKPSIVVVEMTHAQWASMVSSQGIGTGTPCTIRYLNGKRVEEAPYEEGRHELFYRELMEALGELSPEGKSRASELIQTVENLNASKKQKVELVRAIQGILSIFESSVPFVADRFQEFMEKESQARKIETEAHALQALVNMGMGKLAEQFGLPAETAEALEPGDADASGESVCPK